MGMGKTSTCLFAVDTLKLVNDHKTLVTAPLRVAQSVWTAEAAKWDNFAGLKVVPIIGDIKERKEALREPADIHTINYENIPWLAEQVGDDWPWKNIIADESTRLKGFRLRGRGEIRNVKKGSKGSRARHLGKYAFSKAERFIQLTGTPSPNGLKDLWGQLWYLDKGERLGRTYEAFKRRWFYPSYDGFGILPHAYAQEQIQNAVKDICLSLNVKDWLPIKDPVIVDVPVYLPPQAAKLYKQMESEMYVEILDKGIEAFNAGSKSTKCRQIAGGAVYDEDGNWHHVHDAKLDALDSIIEEAAGMPILVAYEFKHELERLKKRFPEGLELDKKPETIIKWNRGDIPLLFTHPASAGHGLNLQDGGNIIVIFGQTWNLELYLQIIERIGPTRQLQAGHDRLVYIYNIRTKNTVDDQVIMSRSGKQNVQDLLMEAARRR
jgi:SNF2 family DNA or RNA helicase